MKTTEILKIGNDYSFFRLVLKVEILDEGDFFYLNAPKMKFKIESNTHNLIEAKKEFIEMLFIYFEVLIKNNTFFATLKELGFSLKPINQAYQEISEEVNKVNAINYKPDLLLGQTSTELLSNIQANWM